MAITIVLNGTSSSGKTSIARALRPLLLAPLQISGIDTFLRLQQREMFPPPGEVSDGFTWTAATVDGINCWDITVGERGEALLRAIHQFWAATAAEGISQIIDHVTLNAMAAADLRERLAPYQPLYVAVRCPLDVIDERERQRGDRLIGQGRGIGAHVHNYLPYDVEIDTSTTSPEEAAAAIVAGLRQDLKSTSGLG
jgi:chloramphenicol 3-O phosphotransferase